jgi:hypothetical protein
MRYDYSSIGFYTFDCLGWPFTSVPEGGGTHFIDELTLAVSGAAGTAAIAPEKLFRRHFRHAAHRRLAHLILDRDDARRRHAPGPPYEGRDR